MPAHPQSNTTLEEINQIIWRHLEERDWHKPLPRDLAISIALEANELLEHYQWSDNPVGDKEELAAELADILIYAFTFAQVNQIDIAEAIRKKLDAAAKKYPAEQYKGKDQATMRANWIETKKNYRKKGL